MNHGSTIRNEIKGISAASGSKRGVSPDADYGRSHTKPRLYTSSSSVSQFMEREDRKAVWSQIEKAAQVSVWTDDDDEPVSAAAVSHAKRLFENIAHGGYCRGVKMPNVTVRAAPDGTLHLSWDIKRYILSLYIGETSGSVCVIRKPGTDSHRVMLSDADTIQIVLNTLKEVTG